MGELDRSLWRPATPYLQFELSWRSAAAPDSVTFVTIASISRLKRCGCEGARGIVKVLRNGTR